MDAFHLLWGSGVLLCRVVSLTTTTHFLLLAFWRLRGLYMPMNAQMLTSEHLNDLLSASMGISIIVPFCASSLGNTSSHLLSTFWMRPWHPLIIQVSITVAIPRYYKSINVFCNKAYPPLGISYLARLTSSCTLQSAVKLYHIEVQMTSD
jgi:hypothetical protein